MWHSLFLVRSALLAFLEAAHSICWDVELWQLLKADGHCNSPWGLLWIFRAPELWSLLNLLQTSSLVGCFILFYFICLQVHIFQFETWKHKAFVCFFLSFFRNRKKNCGSCWHNWAFSYSSSSVQFYEAWAVQSSPSLLGKGRDRRAISEPCRDFSSTWRGNMEKWMLITGRGERLLLMAERRICCKNEFVCSVCLCFPLQKAN